MNMPLSPAQRRDLKARAHGLHPVVMIGDDGLSSSVLAEIERAIKTHELIKIRVFSADRDQRSLLLAEICSQTGAQPVQHIGKVLVIYREMTEPVARASKSRPAKPPARQPGTRRAASLDSRPGSGVGKAQRGAWPAQPKGSASGRSHRTTGPSRNPRTPARTSRTR